MSNTNTHESAAPVAEQASATKPAIHRPKKEDQASPIEQVVVLRNKFRETVNLSNELIRSLKRQKKQSRLVASTLASLKELQKVAG